jgi:hypothetical protein
MRRYLLSYFAISHPETGSPIKEQIGKIKRKLPNSASFISKTDLIVGILDAHEEKQNPARKKKMLNAKRFCFSFFKIKI